MENRFKGPLNFCQYTTDLRLIYIKCQQITYLGTMIENVAIVVFRQNGIPSMRQATLDRLQTVGRNCHYFGYSGMTEDVVFIETNQF